MRVFPLVCFVVAACFQQSHSARAQQSAEQTTLRLSPTIIDGTKEPNRIPDRTIQSALMVNLAMMLHERPERFESTAKVIGLSAADANAMKPYLTSLRETLLALRQQSKALVDGGNGVQPADPVQKTALARPIVETLNRSTTGAWDGVLDALTPPIVDNRTQLCH